MKMSLDGAEGAYHIQGYADGEIRINDVRHTESLLVTLDTLVTEWGPDSLQALNEAHLTSVHELEPEVVLLGTGAQQTFPDRELILGLLQAGIGLEIMDTASACRTYNVLMSEGRRVVAALIIDR
ncbi:Mth938-like domain-containing protein [Spiribacter insolitus]|uniref:Mth938-like domain-containing protein n=1 Tax=Spiribacter insolitus TaxID=3122417 RepID=A0ABV3T742_9GAMM